MLYSTSPWWVRDQPDDFFPSPLPVSSTPEMYCHPPQGAPGYFPSWFHTCSNIELWPILCPGCGCLRNFCSSSPTPIPWHHTNELSAQPESNSPGSFEASCGQVTKSSLIDSEGTAYGSFLGGSVPSPLSIPLSAPREPKTLKP